LAAEPRKAESGQRFVPVLKLIRIHAGKQRHSNNKRKTIRETLSSDFGDEDKPEKVES
jgi:hypothetical protein